MKNEPSSAHDTHADLFPTQELAAKWVMLLRGISSKPTPEERETEFLFVHGWLRGIADAGMLSVAAVPDLRELAIKATRQPKN